MLLPFSEKPTELNLFIHVDRKQGTLRHQTVHLISSQAVTWFFYIWGCADVQQALMLQADFFSSQHYQAISSIYKHVLWYVSAPSPRVGL